MTATILSYLLEIKFFGIRFIDSEDFLELVIRFVFNFIIAVVIVRYLYYPSTRQKDYLFSYLMISTVVFLLCFLLENVKLQLGFALGLFAIFGIIRYRTRQIPVKEMTYLFIIIGLSVINALANKKVSYAELVFTNLAVIVVLWGLEKVWLIRHESEKRVTYEKIELIKPENRKLLIEDLKKRTGLNISRVKIERVNFLRDTARLQIYYFENDKKTRTDKKEEKEGEVNKSLDE